MFEAASFGDLFYRTCLRGYEHMAPEAAECLRQSVTLQQGSGGLFRGRAGQEDLYYTFFGLLLAMVTGANIRPKQCRKALASFDFSALDLVHGCAWLRARHMLNLLVLPKFLRQNAMTFRRLGISKADIEKLQSLAQRPDSAYPQQDKTSPYSRFLLGTLSADFGQSSPRSDFSEYRLPNGLYANLKNHSAYGVNATAAALFLLPPDQCGESADALSALQESDGSFKATASAPEGDLLSTATAVFALRQCGKTPRVSIKPYLRECFRENGLFAATPNDSHGDLEYTVYGLLAMGCLA